MDASFHIRPFAFDRVFAAGAATDQSLRYEHLLERVSALEGEAARAKAGHDAALALASEQGFEAGLAQARAERETALLAAVDALGASLEAVDVQIADIASQVTADAAQIALAAADHLAARALSAQPGGAIDEAIGRVLGQVARGTEIQVRVHPDLVGEIERLIGVRQAGDRRQLHLHVVGDAALAEGDARVVWDGGGLTLDAAEREAAIRAELASLLPHGQTGEDLPAQPSG